MNLQVIELVPELDLLPARAMDAVREANIVILQSDHAECADELRKWNDNIVTLDKIFEEAEDFDTLYEEGADYILGILKESPKAVFCVLGDMGVNGFVRALKKCGVKFEVVFCGGMVGAAVSAARAEFEVLQYTVFDAHGLDDAVIDTSAALVVTGIDNRNCIEDVKCILTDYYAEDTAAFLYTGAGAKKIRLYDIDRIADLGTGAVLVLPAIPLVKKERYGLYDLVKIMNILRSENGCPWDREQTHETLRQYLLEEAYEAVDAIDAEDMYALYDELGDVFLQVVFHAEVGRQCGEFDINDVATSVCRKMIHRHPHIFGEGKAESAQEVVANWEAIKRKEKKNDTFVSVLKDVPRSMGAMMRAYKLQKKAAAIGFDWEDAEKALPKVDEELEEWKEELLKDRKETMEGEAGDLLFAIINVLRLKKTNPELCLNRTCEKFIERMEFMEKAAGRELADMTLEELDKLWGRAKQEKSDKNAENAEIWVDL